jgi:hypothetical protein
LQRREGKNERVESGGREGEKKREGNDTTRREAAKVKNGQRWCWFGFASGVVSGKKIRWNPKF